MAPHSIPNPNPTSDSKGRYTTSQDLTVYGGGLRKIEPKELANVPAGSIFRQLGIRENTSEDLLF